MRGLRNISHLLPSATARAALRSETLCGPVDRAGIETPSVSYGIYFPLSTVNSFCVIEQGTTSTPSSVKIMTLSHKVVVRMNLKTVK